MFTGIIEEYGKVLSNESIEVANHLQIVAPFSTLQAGESIAVNGVCLTLLPDFANHLSFDVSPETLRVTTLGDLRPGDLVNLERAMLASTRFGGHYVSGHVDTTARLEERKILSDCIEMTVGGFSSDELKFLLPKGSISLEGVSLTINAVEKGRIKLLLIPHTIAKTTLGEMQVGDAFNVEFDYLTRIVAHQIGAKVNSSISA